MPAPARGPLPPTPGPGRLERSSSWYGSAKMAGGSGWTTSNWGARKKPLTHSLLFTPKCMGTTTLSVFVFYLQDLFVVAQGFKQC